MIRVSITDDHHVVRMGFVQLIGQQPDISVCFDSSSVGEQLDWLQTNTVDIMITDLSMPQQSGFALLQAIKDLPTQPRAIVLSMHDNDPYVSKALEAGAKGYLSKTSAPQELIEAIRTVHRGQSYLSQSVVTNLKFQQSNGEVQAINQLTDRERQVFDYLAIGMEIKHIARELNIATKTVHVHRANLLAKLEANSNFELTKMALRNGLMEPESLHQ